MTMNFIEGHSLGPPEPLVKGVFSGSALMQFLWIYRSAFRSIRRFARSSAEENARVQGLHYTPVELVHLTLDPVFEDLSGTARSSLTRLVVLARSWSRHSDVSFGDAVATIRPRGVSSGTFFIISYLESTSIGLLSGLPRLVYISLRSSSMKSRSRILPISNSIA